VARQLELFAPSTPSIDESFARLLRTDLGAGAWIDHQAGWVAGHGALFDRLEQGAAWSSERRVMYDRAVDTPRLLASLPPEARPPLIERMRVVLSARYGEAFVRVTAALYRDGADSVAMHGDTTARDMAEAVVATVSLGAPRRFLIKPAAGGRSRTLMLGGGDLLVMGGTAQRTFRHGVPKVAVAGPRIAVMFRPIWDAWSRNAAGAALPGGRLRTATGSPAP
jgi:alkylated DNA repair dioxygenase AlkB